METKKYYGKNEVKDIVAYNDILSTVVLDNGEQILLSNKMIMVAITSEPIDLTKLRETRCFPVVSAILVLLHEWNVNINEVDFIFQRTIMSLNESLKKASDILWGKEQAKQTFEDVHKVLLSNPEEVKKESIPSPFMPKEDNKS